MLLAGRSFVSFRRPYDFGHGSHALLPCSCPPKRSRRTRRSPPGLEHLISRCSAFRLVAPVDASGISQVPWRSVPCLCPAPRPGGAAKSSPLPDLSTPPPVHPNRRPQRLIISRLTQGFSIRCLRFTSDVAAAHAGLASGWRAAPLPGGGRTLWIASKGFRLIAFLLSRTSPVARTVNTKRRKCVDAIVMAEVDGIMAEVERLAHPLAKKLRC